MCRGPSAVAALALAAVLATGGCAAPSPASALTPIPPSPGLTSPPPARSMGSEGAPTNPGDLLDLTDWYLTLPTGEQGDPDTVQQPELATYSGTWFRLNDTADGVVFTAPAGGATTSGSKYPRSELREMMGGEKAAWSNTSGSHTLSVRQAVVALPPAKPEVVTAQIHDGSDDVMEVRLEGERLIAQYDDGDSEIVIDPAYRLGTVFDLRIVAADGRVQVYYNGALGAEIGISGSGWYFKSGSYVQSNPDKGEAADAVGAVVIQALQVSHTG